MTNSNTVKAVRATVKFAEGIEVDGYMLPNGEFRVGKTSISTVLGYSKMWVTRKMKQIKEAKEAETLVTSLDENKASNPNKLVKKKPQTLVTSFIKRFSGEIKQIEIDGVIAETLSLEDFRLLIRLADRDGNVQAQGILDSFIDIGIDDFFRLTFGLDQLTLEEKRAKFYNSYVQTLNWYEEDRKEFEAILDQQRFLYPEQFDENGVFIGDAEFEPFYPESHTDEDDWI